MPLPDVVVTADRIAEPITATGSSITVIPGSQVAKWGTQGITETLREAVGVEVTPSGGPGTQTSVRIRGGDPGAVLVLVDGMRIGNVAATDGSLDFGNLTAVNIDRIEVLRGPQTALYGSDAMAGVINIITKKGTSGEPQRSVSVEGGSYGTISGRASMSGGDEDWTYSLGVNAMYTDGFPQYGYRINRPLTIGDGVTPLPPLPFEIPTPRAAPMAISRTSFRRPRASTSASRCSATACASTTLRFRPGGRVLARQSFPVLDRLGVPALQFRRARRRAEQPCDLFQNTTERGQPDRRLLRRLL